MDPRVQIPDSRVFRALRYRRNRINEAASAVPCTHPADAKRPEDLVPALATTGREASRSIWRIGRDTRMEISTSIRIVPTRVGLPQRAKAQDSRSSRHGLHQA